MGTISLRPPPRRTARVRDENDPSRRKIPGRKAERDHLGWTVRPNPQERVRTGSSSNSGASLGARIPTTLGSPASHSLCGNIAINGGTRGAESVGVPTASTRVGGLQTRGCGRAYRTKPHPPWLIPPSNHAFKAARNASTRGSGSKGRACERSVTPATPRAGESQTGTRVP